MSAHTTIVRFIVSGKVFKGKSIVEALLKLGLAFFRRASDNFSLPYQVQASFFRSDRPD